MALTKQGIYTNDLFKAYYKEDVMKAQMIAKNLFCKEPSNIKIFNSYFSFCTGVVSKRTRITVEECQFFLAEAELALRIFSEKCEMNDTSLRAIENSNETLRKKIGVINELVREQQNKLEVKAKEDNDKTFIQLCTEIGKLQNQYADTVAEKIASLDGRINKELLSQEQIKTYHKYSDDLSQIVSKHLKQQNMDYNVQAVSSFKRVVDEFISDSSYRKEKGRDRLFELLKGGLFNHSQDKLFPETLIYYNYIYSYIFSKLDHEGKKMMTECSIKNKQ